MTEVSVFSLSTVENEWLGEAILSHGSDKVIWRSNSADQRDCIIHSKNLVPVGRYIVIVTAEIMDKMVVLISIFLFYTLPSSNFIITFL